jgi:hypothetical protein
MTHSVPAIESYLPKVGSPLFHAAVEEVVSIMETFPAASYEQAVCQYLINSFFLSTENYDDNDSWYESSASASGAPPSTEVDIVEQKESFFVANKTSEEVNRFLQGQFPAGPKVAACSLGNRCSDATCQFFHGPLCEFHAGMKVHFGGPKRGQKMTCGKGLACPFDHASADLRSARSAAGLQEKRFRHAPKLSTEADILSVFPSMQWRFSDVYTYENLSSAEMDLLEICLERSAEISVTPLLGGLQIVTTDFMDSRDMPEMQICVPISASVPDGFTQVRSNRRK